MAHACSYPKLKPGEQEAHGRHRMGNETSHEPKDNTQMGNVMSHELKEYPPHSKQQEIRKLQQAELTEAIEVAI